MAESPSSYSCCFCKRVSSNLNTFTKVDNLIFCKIDCNRQRLSDAGRKSKIYLDKEKEAAAKKDIDKAGKKSDKKSKKKNKKKNKKKKQSESDNNDDDVGNYIMVDQEMESHEEATDAGDVREPVNDGTDEVKQSETMCGNCSLPDCSKKCSLCNSTVYCSKTCQREDWPIHKETCIKGLSKEQKEIFEIHEQQKRQRDDYTRRCRDFTDETDDHIKRMYPILPLKQAMIIAERPEGSFDKALLLTRLLFPFHDIIIDFGDLPILPRFLLFPVFPPVRGYVLLAFIHRFHENVTRHGVYLKDVKDEKSKVQFFLDHLGDDPLPHFSYSQVKPGSYICLVDPVLQFSGDGTLGIRINDPRRVKVLNM